MMFTPWKCLKVEIQYDTMHKTLSYSTVSTFIVEQMSTRNILFADIQTWYHAKHDVHTVKVLESRNTISHHAEDIIPFTCLNFCFGTDPNQDCAIYQQ